MGGHTNARKSPIYRRSEGLAAAQPQLVPSLGDRLESDHFVRSLRGLAEKALGTELRSHSNLAGGFSYDPVDLLCVWLYGFMRGILTTRRLEEACRYDIRFEYLCRSCRPDHTTLSRFRLMLGPQMDALMLRVLEEGESQKVLGRTTMAVDGTKIAARRSQWLRKARQDADRAQAFEEEAQTMLTHGQYLVGYNVQTAADADSGMIMGYAVSAKPEDSSQMPDVLAAVKKQSGGLSKQAVADKGYDGSQNAVALENAGVLAYLPRARKERIPPFTRAASGQMVCAAGHVAAESLWTNCNGRVYRVYRVSKCLKCPLKSSCPSKGHKQRQMYVADDDPGHARLAANARCDKEDGKRLLRLRGPTIERPFAQIKHRFGLRRFGLAGMAKARTEFGIAVLAYNAQRLIRLVLAIFGCFQRQISPNFLIQAPNPALGLPLAT